MPLTTRKSHHADDDGDDLVLHVNIGAARLGSVAFEQQVRQTLTRHDLMPNQLVLEITETVPVVDLADAASAITRLNGMGVKVALDDFGADHQARPRSDGRLRARSDRDAVPIGHGCAMRWTWRPSPRAWSRRRRPTPSTRPAVAWPRGICSAARLLSPISPFPAR